MQSNTVKKVTMTTKITPTEKLVFDLEDTEMPSKINQRSEFILFLFTYKRVSSWI